MTPKNYTNRTPKHHSHNNGSADHPAVSKRNVNVNHNSPGPWWSQLATWRHRVARCGIDPRSLMELSELGQIASEESCLDPVEKDQDLVLD